MISNNDDIIDSRDVIKRIEELEEELGWLEDAYKEAEEALKLNDDPDEEEALKEASKDALKDLENWDDADELQELKDLAENAEGYSADWKYGATLVRDSYFKTYAMELAEDIGAIQKDVSWPCTCIDWDEATEELRADYTEVDFGGVSYYVL